MKLIRLIAKYNAENPVWKGMDLYEYGQNLKSQGIKNRDMTNTNTFYIGQLEEIPGKTKCGKSLKLGKRISQYNQAGGNFLLFVRIEFYSKSDLKKVEDSFKKVWAHRNLKMKTYAKEVYDFKHKEYNTLIKWIKTYCKVNHIKIKFVETFEK